MLMPMLQDGIHAQHCLDDWDPEVGCLRDIKRTEMIPNDVLLYSSCWCLAQSSLEGLAPSTDRNIYGDS